MALTRRNFLFGIAALPASTLLAGRPLPGLTATVYNGYELHTALGTAGPGSQIILAPGDYGDIGRFILPSAHVHLLAEVPHRTVLRSPLAVEGDFACLEGLALECSGGEFGIHLAATGQQIISQRAVGNGIKVTGPNAEIASCDISGFGGTGLDIEGTAAGAYAHDNILHDCKSRAVPISVGDSQRWTNTNVGARIVNNAVQNCAIGSTESIRCKSSGNIFSGNKVLNSNNISPRHGERNIYQYNVVDRSMGIVIQDNDNKFIGNQVTNIRKGPGIQVMTGSIPWNVVQQGKHPQACNTYLEGNVGLLWIGRKMSGRTYPALNTRVVSHHGSIKRGLEQGTVLPGNASWASARA